MLKFVKARGKISRKQACPPLASEVTSFLQSAVAFVGDGCAMVNEAEFRRRLDVCRTCDRRAGKRCTECACWIARKARGRAFDCPLDRWEVTSDSQSVPGVTPTVALSETYTNGKRAQVAALPEKESLGESVL